MSATLLLALVASSFCASGGAFLLKLGATGSARLIDFLNACTASGLALYCVGSALWIYCLSRAPLSTVYPFNALNFVLVGVLAVVFLGERPTLASIGGTAFILLGIGWLALGSKA